jgi:signal transduction histidine kinase/CheY-like chemotaxis protein
VDQFQGRNWSGPSSTNSGVLKTGEDGVFALVVTDTSRSGPASYDKLDETIVIPTDLQLLLHQSRSLIFMPLWDSARQAFYAGMLGRPVDPIRVFKEHDLLSLSIYGRILTAEITRLGMYLSSINQKILLIFSPTDATDTEATKSDFVSSLSHELRSPLHGCLGAVEVLRETALDKTQKDLLGMIDSCASTLLFTMNHLLDFSKINDLDRTQSRSRKTSQGETSPPSLRETFGQASEDYVCRIVQGVVEGVWYGHDREQAAHEREPSTLPRDHIMQFDRDSPIAKYKDVAVFLYMESHAAWFSMVSAGAWKRLVMNLFGNSLKFCQRGQIEVTLKMVSDPKDPEKKLAHLAVSDTGIGMSENFLKHSLYRPFVQADSLISGTGLGLNIVKQIVKDLQGTISVKSALGVGTRFDVFIPLVERLTIAGETIPDGGEMLDPEANLGGRTLCLLSAPHTKTTSTDISSKRTRLVHSYVKSIAENWFNLNIVSAATVDEVYADIYVAEVSDYASCARLTQESSDMSDRPRIIVVGNEREISRARPKFSDSVVELNYPLGPRSLSHALHAAMKTPQASKIVAVPNTSSSSEQAYETLDIESVIYEPEDVTSDHPTEADSANLVPTEHLLLVDDNTINLKLLSTFVKKLSFAARTAVDGEDAFETYKRFAKSKPFTTILMDISMPKMNGFESSRAIRDFEVENNLPPSKIIALTALGSEASRREAEASGIDEFQTKPVALKTLKGLLQNTS